MSLLDAEGELARVWRGGTCQSLEGVITEMRMKSSMTSGVEKRKKRALWFIIKIYAPIKLRF